MQQENRVAKRYAKALLELSIEQNSLDATYQDMVMLSDLAGSSREFTSFLKSPIVKSKAKLEVFNKLFAGKIGSLSQKFIEVITRKNRESLMASIANSFVIGYNNYKNITVATVTTAVAIDEPLRTKINQLVRKLSTEEVEVKEIIDPSIIGGFVLKVGDKQVDASIAQSLESMRNQFKKNLYKKQF